MRQEKDHLQNLFYSSKFESDSQSEYNQLLIIQVAQQPHLPSQWLRNERRILLCLESNILTLSKYSDGRNKYLKNCMFVSTLNDEKTSFLGKKIKGIF